MYNKFNGGTIEVITGSMFSEKTSTLISRITKSEYAKKTVKVFKPELDTRYSKEELVSHAGARITAIPVKNSKEIEEILFANMEKFPDIIVVDEIQFFDEGIVSVIEKLARLGVSVIAAGLDQDFRGEPFPVVADLLARAEVVTKLTAVCTVCGAPATKSQRLVDGKPASADDDTVKLGAKESYEARCRMHHEVK